MALSLRMITLAEFNETISLWETDPTKDTGIIMLGHGCIDPEQYKKIFSIFKDKGTELQEFDISEVKLLKRDEGGDDDLYAENFTKKGVLGEGGIGRVYLGFDKNISREVAIKELLIDKTDSDAERCVARFIREAKITGQLEHPGIIPVYQLNNKPDGALYYVMKYVRGKTLFAAIREMAAMKKAEAEKFRAKLLGHIIAVSDAIGYAHSKGFIHRDIKPSNIIIGEFGETVILDWGLAKGLSQVSVDSIPGAVLQAEETERSELTIHGEYIGTPSYMPPEQIDSEWGIIDARSDVYSLGVVLFMVLTGRKPYVGKGKEVMDQVVTSAASPVPETFNPEIAPELAAICKKAMSKNRNDRFANAIEMGNELKSYRDGRLVSIYSYTGRELLKRFFKRNKVLVMATAAVLISVIAASGISIHFGIKAHQARLLADAALVNVTQLSEASLGIAADIAEKIEKSLNDNGAPKNTVEFIKSHLPFDPTTSKYQVWLMDSKGLIIYDEDPKQIGKYLFEDAMYTSFPELQQFGALVKEKEFGVGHYKFLAKEGGKIIYKIAAWDTIYYKDSIEWDVVITYPYNE